MTILTLIADITTTERPAYDPAMKFTAYSLIGLLIMLYIKYKKPKAGVAIDGASFRLSILVRILGLVVFVAVPILFITMVILYPTPYMVKEDNSLDILLFFGLPIFLAGMWTWLWCIVGQRFQFTTDGFILVSPRKLKIYHFKEFRSVYMDRYNMVLVSVEGGKLQIPFWYKNSLEIYNKLRSEIGKN